MGPDEVDAKDKVEADCAWAENELPFAYGGGRSAVLVAEDVVGRLWKLGLLGNE